MGKKGKIGKQRKDKYYQLAKETGYRSRAAFKLIQLNRKFAFLQRSRVCIDLCAAPGGWMQVAQQNMPLSSIVIGVDLFPIKPVPGCIGLVEDITTEKCKTAISKEIKTWKADIVLNDGAPNVGMNWLHDAYQQNCLTLSALKLATQFLRKGGWFITKIFRSKDYNALIWVFKQLFRKVHATKPQASRMESAEIFVVCQSFIAPDKIDPKFLDHKYVFEDLELEPQNKVNILQPEKKKKKVRAVGYPENDYTLYHTLSVRDFINKENAIEALQSCNQIILDDEEISSNPKTTPEIKECFKDIKVLGRKDLKALIVWWREMKEYLKQQGDETGSIADAETGEAGERILTLDELEDQEDEAISQQIANLEDEEAREMKRKRKRAQKQRLKLNEKMNLKMVLKGDSGPTEEADDLFQLQQIKNSQALNKISDQDPNILVDSDVDSDDGIKLAKKYERYNKDKTKLDSSGLYYKDSDSELELESESETENNREGLGFSESENDDEDAVVDPPKKKTNSAVQKSKIQNGDVKQKKNPLLVDLDTRDVKTKRMQRAELWFQKDIFKNLEEDEDEDLEIDRLAEVYKKKGGTIIGEDKDEDSPENKQNKTKKKNYVSLLNNTEDSDSEDEKEKPKTNNGLDIDDNTTTDSDSDYDIERKGKKGRNRAGKAAVGENQPTEVKQDDELKRLKRTVKMDEEGLALGTLLASSRKRKRDLIDAAWNRYTFNDTNLPDWFADEEKKHMKKDIPVPEELVKEYKKNLQEINVRPIKKVMEAKARKKKRIMKKMEKAKKKAEVLMENEDIPNKEKAKQIKQLYQKAKATGKKEITYVVAKKFNTAKRMKRPKGVKGQYRVVDPRMKKDLRAAKAKEKTKGRKKGSSKGINKNARFQKTKKAKSGKGK